MYLKKLFSNMRVIVTIKKNYITCRDLHFRNYFIEFQNKIMFIKYTIVWLVYLNHKAEARIQFNSLLYYISYLFSLFHFLL